MVAKKVAKKSTKTIKKKAVKKISKNKHTYRAKFNVIYNLEDENLLCLKITYLNGLKDLLKIGTIKKTTKEKFFSCFSKGKDISKQKTRYKIKSWLINSVPTYRYKKMVFLKELIDKGETIVKLDNQELLDTLIYEMKNTIKFCTDSILRNREYEVCVEIEVETE